MMLGTFEIIGIVVAAAIFVVISFIFIKIWAQGGQFQKDAIRIDGKIVIITGGNGGIGRETALDLAKRGGTIYIACRDIAKAENAKQDIIKQSGNNNVFTMKLDLASFKSIREFVEEFKNRETKLHILINNAGVMALSERQTTKDGLEMQIGTNHFGHFLLTNLLLDVIKDSSPARIINVSSNAHLFGKIYRNDLQLESSYASFKAYFQSKLANVLFSRELAKRLQGTGVTANSLHPGVVRTNIASNLSFIDRLLIPPKIFMKTPRSGAQTSIMLAVDPDLANVTGKYFADCAIAHESCAGRSDETAAWLWEESERITQSFVHTFDNPV